MSSEKPKIQAYVELNLYKQFSQWKIDRGIEKDSAAINELFREFFGEGEKPTVPPLEEIKDAIAAEITAQIDKRLPKLSRLEHLEATIDPQCINLQVDGAIHRRIEEDSKFWSNRLEEKIEALASRLSAVEDSLEVVKETSDSPSDSLLAGRSPQESELLTDIKTRLEKLEARLDVKDGVPTLFQEAIETVEQQKYVIETLQADLSLGSKSPDDSSGDLPTSESPDESPGEPERKPQPQVQLLGNNALSRRLGVNPGLVSRNRYREDFADWSQSKDPSGIAWCYDRESKLFRPKINAE